MCLVIFTLAEFDVSSFFAVLLASTPADCRRSSSDVTGALAAAATRASRT